ncbi:MAG: tail fiber protein [Podoviridae sp. ctda_1]|nr:MAG: tail fiber protein [Podoviridae sp. ctda_1]
MSTGIFQRPNVDQHGYLLPMRISGIPAEYVYLDPYEGRLQVHHNVGSCTVQQVGGDPLPNGHSLSFDSATNEIVIAWPKLYYVDPVTKVYPAEIMDPGFESGSAKKGWEMGMGWSVNNMNNITGNYSACFMDFNGSSHILNKARHRVDPGTVINAQSTVRQGASAKYNVGALTTIQYFDKDNNFLHIDRGNLVDDAAKNRVYPSKVKSVAPEGAYTCSIGAEGVRFKENKELFIDDFKWDLIITEVIESENPLNEYFVELLVTDSIGRIARWSGRLYDDSIYVTSKPYPLMTSLSVGFGMGEAGGIERSSRGAPNMESVRFSVAPTGIVRRKLVVPLTIPPEEFVSVSVTPSAIVRRKLVKPATADTDSMITSVKPSGIFRKKHPYIVSDMDVVKISVAPTAIVRAKP